MSQVTELASSQLTAVDTTVARERLVRLAS